MKTIGKRPSALVTLLFLFIVFIFIIAFAPTQFGGAVTYVIVNGNSMEPNFHLGDLVLVRAESTYGVGDAVIYQNAEMGAYVFHRIIDTELDHFILKGDNNSWLDSYQPAQDEIIGKLWVYIPKLGRAIEWVREPLHTSLMVALLGGVLMSGMIVKPSKRKNEGSKPSTNLKGGSEGLLYATGFLTLAFLALGVLSFTRPMNRPAENIPYQQEGNFFYSAAGTPGVYDSDVLHSGEPVFPKLTCFLNIGFTYNMIGNGIQGINGNQSMVARIMDEESGWFRTIPLNSAAAFTGNSYFSMAALDLCQVESLVNLVEQEAGLHSGTYTLEIISNVALTATIAGEQISDTFNPKLVFKYDKVHFYLAAGESQQDPLHSSKQSMASGSDTQVNAISLLGLKPPVWAVRFISLLGFGFALFGFAFAGRNLYRAANQSQEALIRFKYGSMLVDVYEQNIAPSASVIDVATIDDLARLAERQGTMILHMTQNFLHYYLVQESGTTYRYVISTGRKGIADNMPIANKEIAYITSPVEEHVVEPAPIPTWPIRPRITKDEKKAIHPPLPVNEMPAAGASGSENKTAKPKPAREKVTEYIIQGGEIGFTLTQPETEILRKIRL